MERTFASALAGSAGDESAVGSEVLDVLDVTGPGGREELQPSIGMTSRTQRIRRCYHDNRCDQVENRTPQPQVASPGSVQVPPTQRAGVLH